MHLPIVLVVVGMALLGAVSSQAPDDCERSCGNLSIPFPFGLEPRCYYDSQFLVTCNRTTGILNLQNGPIGITSISAATSELEVTAMVAYECYNSAGRETRRTPWHRYPSRYSTSSKNRFVAVGCDTNAYIGGIRGNETIGSGCISTCNSNSKITNGTCSGVGCCEITIPKGMRFSNISLSSYNNHKDILKLNPCSYAFVVAEGKYNFSTTDLVDDDFGGKSMMMPRLLDWDVGNETCDTVNKESDDFLCRGNTSECVQEYTGPGYQCRCLAGYQGNPYIKDDCTNIDECKAGTHNCKGECKDTPGNYTCPCPNGKPGEYRKDDNTCTGDELPIIQISVGASVGGLFLILLFTWIYFWLKRRNKLILREKFFEQNGGILLKQRISADGPSQIQAKVFTVEELEKATNNYDESTIIGKGGFGTVYKGILPDNRVVAIKKSKIADQNQTQVEQFINEVIIVSQINHRNVVKLIGCCLETEVPSLVYEFIPNGTLFDHIHDECKSKVITWAIRLKLATETAGALSYLHSAASVPIIHRDVKPMNVLIDNNFVAKVADFGASKLIPMDQKEVATMVQGTLGYLDPEYLQTGQLTEKSDVYSFGVVLVELLTGKKIVDFTKPEQERQHVTKYFISCLKNKTLLQVLDKNMQLKEVPHEIIQVSRLAQRCLHLKGDERPTMKEVALELEGISAPMIERVKSSSNGRETEHLLNGPSEDREDNDNMDTSSITFYSIEPVEPRG